MARTIIKVLNKEQCLSIAKLIDNHHYSDDEHLEHLPDEVFGNCLRVSYFSQYIYALDENDYIWAIPTYFVESIEQIIV